MNNIISLLSGNLPLLRVSCSKEPLPPYASYLNFTPDNRVMVCNDIVYTEITTDVPLVGSVNFYILEGMLKNLDVDAKLFVKKSNLIIQSPQFRSTLPIINLPLPSVVFKPDVPTFELTKETIDLLKIASKFVSVSEDRFKDICLSNGHIYAIDGERMFYSILQSTFDTEILVNRLAHSILRPGMKIGNSGDNLLVDFSNGFSLFSSTLYGTYPQEKIQRVIDNLLPHNKLCNVSVIQQACERLSPLAFGEESSIINIKKDNDTTKITMESAINGTAFVEIGVEDKSIDLFNMNIATNKFNGVPDSFDVYIENVPTPERLILKDGESIIILMGFIN